MSVSSEASRAGGPASRTRDSDAIMFNDENNIEDMHLTFGVAREEYGVAISFVTEIVGMQRIMPVPDVPHFIKGVINLRGKVIPIMDMRARFGMAEAEYTERTVIIVLDVDAIPIGLVVDEVRDVLEILPASIDPPPQFGSVRDNGGLIRGLGKSGDLVAVILDIRRLVCDEAALDHAIGAAVQ